MAFGAISGESWVYPGRGRGGAGPMQSRAEQDATRAKYYSYYTDMLMMLSES